MKSRLISAFSFVALALGANAATTVTISNFTNATTGVAIVTAGGAAVDQGQVFASAGYFTSAPNFATMSAQQLLSIFTTIDATPVALNATIDGVFNAQDYNQASLPAGFVGSQAFVVVGNYAALATSTLIAVYSAGVAFAAPDGGGNSAQTIACTNIDNWVYGIKRSVTTQPAGFNLPNGIVLTLGVPEPTVALLGSLGLLGLIRRRR